MKPQDVLDFWFGPLDARGLASDEHKPRWWKKDPAFDAAIRDQFEASYNDAAAGKLDGWLADAPGRLAVVILLDQFSRNMFRDTAKMYAADARSLEVALAGVGRGDDRALVGHARVFLYMPLMHAEHKEAQRRCVQLFEAMAATTSGALGEAARNHVDYAIQHRDIVERFGRFPHRNKILGRASTEEEEAFLQEPGSSF